METILKKSLAVLASAVFIPAAYSQSSTSVYGLVDLSIGHTTISGGAAQPSGGTPFSSRQSQTRMDSGLAAGSRLGFKGVEDLGGGLNVRFQLEMGIAADTGGLNQGGLAWGRMAYLGIGEQGWSLTAGRLLTPMHSALATSEALAGGYWGNITSEAQGVYEAIGSTPGNGSFQLGARADNAIQLTLNQGAWTAHAIASAGNENQRGTGRYLSVVVNYQSGPLKANAAIAKIRQNAEQIIDSATPEWQTSWMIGGSYDFGAVALYTGLYQFTGPKNRSNLSSLATVGAAGANPQAFSWNKNKLAWIGVKVPVFSGNLMTQIARETYPYTGNPDGKSTIFAVAYEYPLSKRTTTYASYGQVRNNARARTPLYGAIPVVGPNGFGADARGLSVGLRHTF